MITQNCFSYALYKCKITDRDALGAIRSDVLWNIESVFEIVNKVDECDAIMWLDDDIPVHMVYRERKNGRLYERAGWLSPVRQTSLEKNDATYDGCRRIFLKKR